MSKVIPYGRQEITEEDIKEVTRVLKSDYLTQGPEISLFEDAFSNYVGSKYAVAVSNGTAGLHLACMVKNLKPEQQVITTAITFSATANSVRYCGAEPIFCDIDPKTYLLDIEKVRDYLNNNKAKSIVGIIPVEFTGRPIDREAWQKLCDEFGLWLIVDSCHAPGAYFKDSNGLEHTSGNSKFESMSVFSFHPVKHIACGEGGMVTTNDEQLYTRLTELRTHGISREKTKLKAIPSEIGGIDDYPAWYMEMQELGLNYRLTDIQAALGRSQLSRAEKGLSRRREIAQKYADSFVNCSFISGQSGYVDGHAYHLYVIEVENRLGLYNYLRENKIYCQIHYIPTHIMPYYKDLGWKLGDLPNSEKYYQQCISLPMFPTLSDSDQERVIAEIKSFYN